MGLPNLTGQDLIDWVDRTSDRWRNLLANHPEALDLPCDIRETNNVGGLLQHVVAVELRYAERLCELPETPYDSISFDSAETLHAVHQRAMTMLLSLTEYGEDWWQHVTEFRTRSGGRMQASRRVIFMHLLLHSIRHYAQLATIARQHGIEPDWMMDYLDMRFP